MPVPAFSPSHPRPPIRVFSFASFAAAKGTNLVSQTVQIQAMDHLPPETEVFGLEPSHGLPDAEDNDYIMRNEVFCGAAESFNWQWRTNRIITLAGKKLVFQAGHPNGLYAYNDNRGYQGDEYLRRDGHHS